MSFYDEIAQEVEAWTQNPYTYNTSDMKAMLNPLLEATGQGTLSGVSIRDIMLTEESLDIEYEYSARGHADASSVQLPVFILKASNPLLQATRYKLLTDIQEVENRKTAAARTITACLNQEAKLKAQLAALDAEQAS